MRIPPCATTFKAFIPQRSVPRLPGVNGFGCLLIVDRNGSQRFSGTYSVGDDVTWAPGRHTFKFGVEARDAYSNSTNDFLSRPTVDFNNFANFGGVSGLTPTGDPNIDSNPTLQDMIWSLFGVVGSVNQAQFFDKRGNRTANDLRGFRQQDFAAFAQDTFKILPNFTMNYGLRYQFNGPHHRRTPVAIWGKSYFLSVAPRSWMDFVDRFPPNYCSSPAAYDVESLRNLNKFEDYCR